MIVSSADELLGHQTFHAVVRDKTVWQWIQLEVLEDLMVARTTLKETPEAAGVGVIHVAEQQDLP